MVVVDAMDDPVQARSDPVLGLEVEDDPVQPVLGKRPQEVATQRKTGHLEVVHAPRGVHEQAHDDRHEEK